MNASAMISSRQMLETLKTGRTLRLCEIPALVRYENGLFYVTLFNCTQRLKQENFLALYGNCPAVLLEERADIDEQRDEEYYAWRREKQ